VVICRHASHVASEAAERGLVSKLASSLAVLPSHPTKT